MTALPAPAPAPAPLPEPFFGILGRLLAAAAFSGEKDDDKGLNEVEVKEEELAGVPGSADSCRKKDLEMV